jgi:hypothetical protein
MPGAAQTEPLARDTYVHTLIHTCIHAFSYIHTYTRQPPRELLVSEVSSHRIVEFSGGCLAPLRPASLRIATPTLPRGAVPINSVPPCPVSARPALSLFRLAHHCPLTLLIDVKKSKVANHYRFAVLLCLSLLSRALSLSVSSLSSLSLSRSSESPEGCSPTGSCTFRP